jgi:glycosyltransferase involved in cell wall biosynthesis
MHLVFDARMADGGALHGLARYLSKVLHWGLVYRPQHRVQLLTCQPQAWSGLVEAHPQLSLLPVACPPFHWREHWELARALSRSRADLAFFPSLAGPLWSPVPYCMTVPDLIPWHYPRSPLVKPYLALVSRWRAWRALELVAISQFTAREANRLLGVSPGKLQVIYLGGLDLPRAAAGPAVRQRPYFLCVTNPKPHKNLSVLLEAFSGLEHACDLVLVCPPAPALDSLPPAVERLHGLSDETLAGLYQGCLAAVVPSLYEGFGLPALEAMQLGAPVVVANSSSLPEVVGEAGLYFDPANPEELRKQLRSLLENSARAASLSEAGKARATLFSWDQCCRTHWDWFEKLQARKSVSASRARS